MGHLYVSRIATGRKMGYAYEIHGTKGAIRFDQEDQNALWLYRAEGPEATRGFTQDPDRARRIPITCAFCQGPGHGTGYQDQIIIEARDFLQAIATGQAGLAHLPRRAGGEPVIDAAFRPRTTARLASTFRRLSEDRHDHPHRQCALFLGRGIRRRSAQPALAARC